MLEVELKKVVSQMAHFPCYIRFNEFNIPFYFFNQLKDIFSIFATENYKQCVKHTLISYLYLCI